MFGAFITSTQHTGSDPHHRKRDFVSRINNVKFFEILENVEPLSFPMCSAGQKEQKICAKLNPGLQLSTACGL